MRNIFLFASLIFAGNLGMVSAVLAAPPYNPNLVTNGNAWLITGYRDAHFAHQWQTWTWKICFTPVTSPTQPCYNPNGGMEQTVYQWISNFPGWSGCAVQEGDQIFMNGNFGNNAGNDSMYWEIVTLGNNRTEGSGHWIEWLDGHQYDFFGNTKLVRNGKCPVPLPIETRVDTKKAIGPSDDKDKLVITPSDDSVITP